MLYPVAELGQHLVRNVDRILGDEIDPDALGADQAHHLLDLLHQRLGRVIEQEVGFVEKEHQLRLRRVADLGQMFEQLRQHPQQERRIEFRALHQPVGNQDVDHPTPVPIRPHEIVQRQRGLAEKLVAALVFQHQKLALDGSDRLFRNVTVLRCQLGRMLGDKGEDGSKILHVEQQ